MLEELIKVLFMLILISFFIFVSLNSINESGKNALIYLRYNSLLNELRNGTTGGNGSLRVCIPSLINNNPGRSCIA